jgi:lactoylglutathione lyase
MTRGVKGEHSVINAFHHLKIDVADINRSIEFYCGKLAFKQIVRYDRDDGVTIVQLSPSGQPPGIELWYEESNDGFRNDRLHFAFSSDNVEALVDWLRNQGVCIQREIFKLGDETIAFIRDPDGYLIELHQKDVKSLSLLELG